MTIEIFKTLSTSDNFPFGNSLESFFNKYTIKESIECYNFFCDPSGSGTSLKDLERIKYSKDIIIWVAVDSLLTTKPYNYYTDKKIDFLYELEEICRRNKDKKFILFCSQHSLQKFVSISNLFITDLINLHLPQQYKHCDTKNLDSSPWICLNSGAESHKFAIISYLIGKQFDKNGKLCIDKSFSNSKKDFKKSLDLFQFDVFQKKIVSQGFENFLKEKFIRSTLPPYSGNNLNNYQNNLISIYQTTVLEIVVGSLFFEPMPFFGEKEIQCIYGKNLPIFINAPGSVEIFREKFGFDMFDDIIDHSYDSIEDPSIRIFKAIDNNEHLLRNDKLLHTIWSKNKKRFTKNCKKLDKFLFDKNFQINFDEKNIKKAFDYFKISYSN